MLMQITGDGTSHDYIFKKLFKILFSREVEILLFLHNGREESKQIKLLFDICYKLNVCVAMLSLA